MQRPGAAGASLVGAQLLERSRQLAALEACFEAVRDGAGGSLALVRGEAGIGKSVVVRQFCDRWLPPARVLWGACEPLFTPRALGAFVDIASWCGGRLEEIAEHGGTPYEVLAALSDEAAKGRPTIVVLEDLHWADEATLDVLRLLGRRIQSFPGLVLARNRGEAAAEASRIGLTTTRR